MSLDNLYINIHLHITSLTANVYNYVIVAYLHEQYCIPQPVCDVCVRLELTKIQYMSDSIQNSVLGFEPSIRVLLMITTIKLWNTTIWFELPVESMLSLHKISESARFWLKHDRLTWRWTQLKIYHPYKATSRRLNTKLLARRPVLTGMTGIVVHCCVIYVHFLKYPAFRSNRIPWLWPHTNCLT